VGSALRGTVASSGLAGTATARARARHDGAVPPDVLGDPLDLPDPALLPRAMGLLTSAQLLLASESGLGEDATGPRDDGAVTGVGVGDRVVAGTARVFADPADALAGLEPGDVLVTASTNPSWNAVLPLAGALVVEEGGALSHAAIIARELDLPAVIGARGATAVLADGAPVVVDPAAGSVRQDSSAAWARAQR
jgi:phosphohistidine swiveling domain-containing protein